MAVLGLLQIQHALTVRPVFIISHAMISPVDPDALAPRGGDKKDKPPHGFQNRTVNRPPRPQPEHKLSSSPHLHSDLKQNAFFGPKI